MPLTALARPRWQAYFDDASRAVSVQTVLVELTGLGIGDRLAADRAPLSGLSYEPADDTLTLFVQGLEHRIRHPRAIHVDEEDGHLCSLEAVDGEGVHHIVQFSTPLALHAA